MHPPKPSGRKKKIKSSTYTPGDVDRRPSHSAAAARTLQTTKFKSCGQGKFKMCSSRGTSGVAVPNVAINDPRSTEEILDGWFSTSKNLGWDEAYVNSFVENDLVPPQCDPEVPSDAPQATSKGDTVLHEWTKEVDSYLQVIITLEGRGRSPPELCQGRSGCQGPALYRCLNCHNLGLLCGECMRESHLQLPLHRIERWNGNHFERTLLRTLGLRIQLGHPPGETCCVPYRAYNDDFVIIDCDMIHSVALDYCQCGHTAKSQTEQLLEHRLYPATIVNPKTAATFRALELFEMLQYECKLTPYEFYNAISHLTDNTGLQEPKDRYPSLLRMVHEWRHTRLLKRSGKGHDPGGANSTKEGECAVLCPPCPHPGINMPDDWEDEPEETRYIHSLNVGLDANYRLKRKDVSNDEADPGLSKGFAYFVNDKPFKKLLKKHEDDTEPKSTCSRHDAVNLADIRPGQGYAASGVATVECTRHNMKRPGAVCDLQKGEKYFNMDYIMATSFLLLGVSLLRTFLISYDIACQWSVNLFQRIAKINKEFVERDVENVEAFDSVSGDLVNKVIPILNPGVETRFVVPKFHLPAHIPGCQTKFAFMFTPGAGLGDGEAPERGNQEGYHRLPFGNYNWRRVTQLGSSLLKKMTTALDGVAERIIAYRELEEGLDEKDVSMWHEEVVAYERDPTSVPNPFDMTIDTPSQSAVRKALADEEAAEQAGQKNFSLPNAISPLQLVTRGLDLESEMRSLKASMKQTWDHSGDRELTRIQLKSNVIVRKVDAWYRTLQLHIPESILLREEDVNSSKTVKPYDLSLWLPSQIGRRAKFPITLAEIEFKLRKAQALDALTTIRRNLQRRATVYDLKHRWLRGQGANTRALNLVSTLQRKIESAKEEYLQARKALLSLAGVLGKKKVEEYFLPLANDDLRALSPESTITAPSAGQTKAVGQSWIWKHPGASDDNLTAYEAQNRKIEWAKTRARSLRYQEEVQIVREEMKRTLRFFKWKERQWLDRAVAKEAAVRLAGMGDIPDPEHAEGLKAYSQRQASLCRAFHDSLMRKWCGVNGMIEQAKLEVENPELIATRREKENARRLKYSSHSRAAKQAQAAKTA
ncbi:hypothetical protein NMY22_g8804 [Coprinellus aureogranulatus]|nr:hypothetical protein NMY22_g8804 [Coprinellus aureogranulatus]